jgi:dihydrofolate synthase/folylpolyglutamate synthase
VETGTRRTAADAFTTYREALAYLFNFTDYERMHRVQKATSVFGLSRMARILDHCGNPQRRLRAVHVAGTKGKGSTAAILALVLRSAGRTVGLYTSPHLLDIRERIQIDGEWISEDTVVRFINHLHPYLRSASKGGEIYAPTFFETFTTMAFLHFLERDVDVSIFEVGLGGRLDATNVLVPQVCAITPISFDHVDKLGDTLAKIAGEKAGIVKEGVPVVSGVQPPEALDVIRARCAELHAPLRVVGEDVRVEPAADGTFSVSTWRRTLDGLRIPLAGRHQLENAATAVGVAECLGELTGELTDEAVREGVASVSLPGRIQQVALAPDVIVDGAHNVASITVLLATLDSLPPKPTTFVVGIAGDKDVPAVVGLLAARGDAFVVTRAGNPRAEQPERLKALIQAAAPGKRVDVADTPAEAVELARARAKPGDRICVTGSMYLAGDALKLFRQGAE